MIIRVLVHCRVSKPMSPAQVDQPSARYICTHNIDSPCTVICGVLDFLWRPGHRPHAQLIITAAHLTYGQQITREITDNAPETPL